MYGLRTSGASFRAFLAKSFSDLGFKPYTRADPDVWMHHAVKPNGFMYYEYFIAYVDDILLISHSPEKNAGNVTATRYQVQE